MPPNGANFVPVFQRCKVATWCGATSSAKLTIMQPRRLFGAMNILVNEVPMKIDGSCFCGKITFKAEVDPESVTVCHCTDCQVLTGSAFRLTIRATAANVSFSGEPQTFLKIADSGRRRRHGFCGSCGTPLFATEPDEPLVYAFRVGTIRQRSEFRPKRQLWVRSKLPWLSQIENCEAQERQ